MVVAVPIQMTALITTPGGSLAAFCPLVAPSNWILSIISQNVHHA